MKISWPRQASTQLRLPPICAATGEPAARTVPMLFRNRYSYWLPGIGRLIMNLTSPYLMLAVPLSEGMRKRVLTWRLVSLGMVLGGLALGVLLAVVLQTAAGGGLFFLLVVAGLVGSIIARLHADVVGTDVNGDVISLRKAHPAFVQAVVASNPPGVFQVEAGPADPRPQYAPPVYPQAQPGYQHQGYPQQPYPQQPYPQQPYPQQSQPPAGYGPDQR